MKLNRKFHQLIAVLLLAYTPAYADFTDISVADRLAIQELLANYAHTWDSKDVDGYVALFTEDATYTVRLAGALASEFDSLEQRLQYAATVSAGYRSQGIQTRHFIANTVLTLNTDNSITGMTYFYVTYQQTNADAPVPKHTGIYTDTFVRTGNGWKIARHEIYLDHR